MSEVNRIKPLGTPKNNVEPFLKNPAIAGKMTLKIRQNENILTTVNVEKWK